MKRIYVLVAVDLKEECSDDQVQDMISSMDYSFIHPMIRDTAIDDHYDRRPDPDISKLL